MPELIRLTSTVTKNRRLYYLYEISHYLNEHANANYRTIYNYIFNYSNTNHKYFLNLKDPSGEIKSEHAFKRYLALSVDMGLIKKIQKAVYKRRKYTVIENVIHSRENAAIPRAIYIHATDKKIIEDIANQVGISCDVTSPASWRLACLSTAINEIKAGISFVEYAEPGWKKRTFNKERLVFSNSLIEEESQRLVEYRHPFTNQLHHWLWMNNTAAEVNRDWGRYMVLSDAGYNILIYNEQEFKLAVPATIPLPCLLARAAALCSGIPPLLVVSKSQRIGNIPPNHPFQIYSRVPPKIATTIAQKLCQKFINKSFTVDKKGILYA